jgi:hypothetical protein
MRAKARTKAELAERDLTRSKQRNSYMPSPLKRAKLRQLAVNRRGLFKEVNSLKAKLAKYELKSQNLIQTEGIHLTEDDSEVMLQLAKECKDTTDNDLQPETFQSVFLDAQIKYNSLKNKSSMRWHPAIIRWCLYI